MKAGSGNCRARLCIRRLFCSHAYGRSFQHVVPTGAAQGGLMTTLFAFLHHLFAFTLVAMLAVELVLTRQQVTLENARRLIAIDGVYGASAGLLLIVGL